MFKYQNNEDLMAAITSLYAFKSLSWDLAMTELRKRLTADEFIAFCKQNNF